MSIQLAPLDEIGPKLTDIERVNAASRKVNEQIRAATVSAADKNAMRLAEIQRVLAPLPFGIGQLVAKDFSPDISVVANLNQTIQVSASQVITTTSRILGAMTYAGKTVPI
jgi:hypothetical protein